MDSLKPKTTELELASQLVLITIKNTQEAWPNIYKSYRDLYKDKFVVTDETMAIFDLALAAIAENLQAVKNVFSEKRAERIKDCVLECINSEDWGEYAIHEVNKYGEIFQKSLNDMKTYGNPLEVIPARLLYKLLGESFKNFEVEIAGKKTGIIDPFLVTTTSGILVQFLLQWKKIKEDYSISEDANASNGAN